MSEVKTKGGHTSSSEEPDRVAGISQQLGQEGRVGLNETARQGRRARVIAWWRRRERRLIPYVFLAPNLLVFGLFMFWPMLYAVYISLHDWTLIGVPEFAGMKNYVNMMQDGRFWQALRNTVVFTVGVVPFSMALGLIVALMIDRKLPARGFLRSAYFLPVIVSGVVTALIAAWLFNPTYGVVNTILANLGLSTVPWLSSTTWAMPTLILVTLWTRVGFCMVVYLAGLQSIPATYYDAAAVDGASGWHRFRDITWPLLMPTTFFLLITSIIYSFHVFDLIYVMTGGGPGFSTTVLVQYIYQTAFQTQQMGYASAMGVMLFVFVLIFTVIQWRITRQGEATT